MAHYHGVDYRELLEGKLVLIESADALVGRGRDIACRRDQAAVENFHKCRFATSIRADEAVTVAVAKFDRDVLEEWLGGELHGDIGGRDHWGYSFFDG